VAPAAGQTLEDLPRVAFAAEHGLAVLVEHRLAAIVRAFGMELGHARLAEVLLRQDVDRDLAPLARCVEVACLEDERTVGVPDLRAPLGERDAFVGRLAFDRETTSDLHAFSSWPGGTHPVKRPPLFLTRTGLCRNETRAATASKATPSRPRGRLGVF
jgi:hypothetical protein